MKMFICVVKTLVGLWVILLSTVFIVAGLLLITSEAQADGAKYHLNLLPASRHVNNFDHNERHEGVGVSMTHDGVTYGAMSYVNSFGKRGPLFSVSANLHYDCTVCLGVGLGLAPAYTKDDEYPVIAWLSFNYKWVTILNAPGEVTAIVFSVPLN